MPQKKNNDQKYEPAMQVTDSTRRTPSSSPKPEDGMGERIKKRREELGLNYEELARLTAMYDYWEEPLGLTSAMLARYEKGKDGKPILPGARELRILCQALDVTADWLLRGTVVDPFGKQFHATASEVADVAIKLMQTIEKYQLFKKSVREHDFGRDEKLQRAKKR